jgi:potassium efflux system protein
MLKFQIRLLLTSASLCFLNLAPTNGQTTSEPTTNTAATNAPAATAPATPAVAPIALGNVVAQAQAATTKIQDLQKGLDPDQTLQDVSDQLPDLSTKIDERIAADTRQSQGSATLSLLQNAQTDWRSISSDLAAAQLELSKRVSDLDKTLGLLNQLDATWKSTLASATNAKAPPEITNRVNEIRASIADATKDVQAHQAPLYAMQSRVAAEDARTQSGLDAVNKEIDLARQQLFQQNRPALWSAEAFAHPANGVVGQEKASLQAEATEVVTYLKAKIGALLVHLLLLLLLISGFFWMRNTIKPQAEKTPALQGAAHVLDVPIANAFLLALLVAVWLYPAQPRLLWAAAGALALIPTVIITRRLIDPESLPILYATVVAFFVDQLRYVVTPAGILSRFLFIFELLAASAFILTALRFKHLSANCPEQTRLKRLTRVYLHAVFIVLVFAGFADVFGYIKLSVLVGEGMLQSSYLAVILYAALRVVDALAISALSIWPLSRLGMVRRHHDLVYATITIGIRWLFFAIWIMAALQFFSQRDLFLSETHKVLKTQIPWFHLNVDLEAILAFPITIWASFLLSRFARFVLEEEVYPHLQLGRGIPYAASTMVHYVILIFGCFVALSAANIDLSKYTVLAGAFGVGLGFGLQNIMNNFMSGIILLFERPVKVGDVIQLDAATIGKVERIGIRASVIMLANGAEVIVPNGNLISNPVTNWTFSNCERQIEIPITVVSKADPQHVISLLTNIAVAHSDVLKNPAPRAYLVTLGSTSLTFRLSAWIDSAEEWMKITSDLSLAINSALARENIALG